MLQQISIYLLKVICISGVLFLYYYIALRNKQFHFYNRFYLLMAVSVSAVLPLVQLHWFTFFSGSPQTIHLYKIIYGKGEEDVIVNENYSFSLQQIALYIFGFTCLFLTIMLSLRVVKIHRIKKQYPVQHLPEFDFINTDISSAPFSFLKNIFWRNDINLNEETGKQILQHELAHIQQKHSWDKLFMQLVLCFYWLNPFFYLIKKELYLIHEFIADEKAVKHSDADAFAKMLLTTQFGKFNFLPAQSIFYSSIKRRLVMLTTSKKPQFNYLRRLMVLPLVTLLVCLFSFTIKTNSTHPSLQKIKAAKPFTLVVDAGHGGKDFGAEANGLYEKDIALKIAEKIKSLSSQYGVDVILTRSNDVFMSPKEKSDFANMQNANAFISIHINAADANELSKSGVEVVLTQKNQNLMKQNQVLGSSILQSMSTDFKTAPDIKTQNTGIWVVDNSNIPSALIECGYITNTADANNLKDDAKLNLMAQHILQGVTAYANSSDNTSTLMQVDNENDTTPKPSAAIKNPLHVLNGKIISADEFKKIDQSKIENVNVLKGKDATDKYGDKGKNGVIEITLKAESGFAPPVIENNNTGVANASKSTSGKAYTTAQQEPQFPGGIKGWQDYLVKNLDASVPAKRNAPKGIYTVTVSFLVDENGKVTNVKALTNPGYGTAEEAVRVIAQGPNWIPANENGQAVTFMDKQNISFNIN